MEWNEVMEQHGEAIGIDGINETFATLQTKLGEAGIDILLNNKEAQEFVPGSRLSSVVAERNKAKENAENFQKELEALKKSATGNEPLTKQIEVLSTANQSLLADMEAVRVDTAIQLAFSKGLADNVTSEDVMLFVNKEALEVTGKGKVLGVEEELKRLQKEKPYLFSSKGNTGGSDRQAGGGDKLSMNDLIRGGFGN